jgi:hypothetical protein
MAQWPRRGARPATLNEVLPELVWLLRGRPPAPRPPLRAASAGCCMVLRTARSQQMRIDIGQ